MAKCIDCNIRIGFTNNGMNGRCTSCSIKHHEASQPTQDEALSVRASESHEAHVNDGKIAAVVLSTEAASNLNIVKRIDIVTAEVAYGMHVFKDLFASVRDIVGGRSKAIETTMQDARKEALFELRREAYSVGANAVVGVSLNYLELSSTGNMVMLVASGTAVIVEDL